jgi:hypothetical protein
MLLTDDEWAVCENNLGLRFAGSESLRQFRDIFPVQTPRKPATRASDYRSPFVAAVLELNQRGVEWREAQWAAGQATCRLDPGADFEQVLGLAVEILKAREAA